MKEAKITKQTKDLLDKYKKALGHDIFSFKCSQRFEAGLPDYYILYKGQTLWIELKKVGEKVTEKGLQELTLRRLNQAGAEAVWFNDFFQVERYLEEFFGFLPSK